MVQSAVFIRTIAPNETRYAEQGCNVINNAYRSAGGWTSEKDLVREPRVSVQDVEKLIINSGNPNTLLFAFEEDQVVGTAVLQPSLVDAGEAEIALYCVSVSHQSRGIGAKLLLHSMDEVKRLGHHTAYLKVLENRPEVLAFYAKHGFTDSGERIPYHWPERLMVDTQFAILKKRL
ncbi:uncharacterized protein ATC70_010598 [Mucor velutinosus]|uniref:N-acetyltransferase domain-containing protein n=1 Tax=Mucor velutinosus TaxID=708070 RepID=A0AAN7I0Y0_9FUNG|nr:hypothetical protein ATC70_010598 [Mucor velutinosus]